MMKVLIVESEFLHQDTWVGSAVERLADALSRQNVTVIKSTSFDDGYAILAANEAIDCLMFSYHRWNGMGQHGQIRIKFMGYGPVRIHTDNENHTVTVYRINDSL